MSIERSIARPAFQSRMFRRRGRTRRLLNLLLRPVLEFCIEPIRRSCSYVFYYKRYVERLEYAILGLCDSRALLRQEVDRAKREKKSISPEVERWLAEMDAFEEQIRRFMSDVESGNHLYDPMARYSLSHKSVEKLRLIYDRLEEVRMFHNVTDPAPPPSIGSTFVSVLNPEFSTPN